MPDAVDRMVLDIIIGAAHNREAICSHRCRCDCHRGLNVKHVMSCCTGCGQGHSHIDEVLLKEHLRMCHGITVTPA